METYKPQPFEERKSQKLNFWDFFKERMFWQTLPWVTGGAAVLFGVITKFKVFPLDGSPNLITHACAKISKLFTKKTLGTLDEATELYFKKWEDGRLLDEVFKEGGLDKPKKWRMWIYNFGKGAEVTLPFSAYFLWHKKEGKRLQLQEVDQKLKGLHVLKPSDAELAEQNDVMRKELAFAARPPADIPPAIIDAASAEHHGKVVERQKERA